MSEQRTIGFDVELRTEQLDSKGILEALVVPYGELSTNTPYPHGERFLVGAFRKAAQDFAGRSRRHPVLLFRAHEHRQAVGKATQIDDADAGLLATFQLSREPHGRAVAAEVLEGLLPGMSVGFRAVLDRINPVDRAREVVEAMLLEASVVPIGAYDGAAVLSLREPSKPIDLSYVSLPDAPSFDPSRPVSPWG